MFEQPILLRPYFWASLVLAIVALMSLDLLCGTQVLSRWTAGSIWASGGAVAADRPAQPGVFHLPGATRELSSAPFQNASQSRTVLEVTNRPGDPEEQPGSNPARNETVRANSPEMVAPVAVQNVPMLTSRQAEQVFDSAALSPQRISGYPTVQTPIGYFPFEGEAADLAAENQSESEQRNIDDSRRQPWVDWSDRGSNRNPIDPADPDQAPMIPLAHPDLNDLAIDEALPQLPTDLPSESLAESSSESLAEPSASLPLVPSTEITPIEPEPDMPTNPLRVHQNMEAAERPAFDRESATAEAQSAPSPPAEEAVVFSAPTQVWPRPEFLLQRVDAASRFTGLENWSAETARILLGITELPSLGDPRALEILQQLTQQAGALEPWVISLSTVATENPDEALGPASLELRRLAYNLRQQADVWIAAHQLAASNFQSLADLDRQELGQFINASYQRLSLPGISSEWSEYLCLEELAAAFSSVPADRKRQQSAARRFLTRLSSPVLDVPQRQFLVEHIDPALVEHLTVAAREELQLSALLAEIEHSQATRSGVALHRVNQHFQNLIWHEASQTQDLANAIDTHFRNANFRMSVSAELLNLLLPQTPEVHEPVNENIFGARVNGQSRVANRLQIRLIPDASRIQMRLEAIGRVFSQTEAERSGFTVQNVGDARFQVFKRLLIGRDGIVSERPQASSKANNRMIGMKSNLDGVPLLGWVARRIAERKIAEQSPQVKNYTEQKLEQSVSDRFDTEIEAQLADMQQYLFQNMIQPLTALDLEPTPLEMRSTDQRVIMRYRLAGFDQMAGNTARPRGLQNSLLSMQIHESTINNLLNRIDLNGQEFSAFELSQHLAEVFGLPPSNDPQAAKAKFEFAPFDPIRIKFSEGLAAIQLNLCKLRIGEGKTWKNLTVTCRFIPHVDGNQIVFLQDGAGVELTGQRLGARDQVAVRAIFTALFKNQYQIPILPENIAARLGPSLTLSQLEVCDGWIGLSVDKAENVAKQRMSGLEPAAR